MPYPTIAIIGEIAAGKDVAAAYLAEKTGLAAFTLSDILKEMAAQQHIPIDRPHLLSLVLRLSEERGAGYLSQVFCERHPEPVILTGMRQLGQLAYLRKDRDIFLIALTADPEVRYRRSLARAKAGDTISYAEFLRHQHEETETPLQNFAECAATADAVIENNGTETELHEKLDAILKTFSENGSR